MSFRCQKEPKTRRFQTKKNTTVLWGQILKHLNWCPLRFLCLLLPTSIRLCLFFKESFFAPLLWFWWAIFQNYQRLLLFNLSFGLFWEACVFFFAKFLPFPSKAALYWKWFNSSNIKGNTVSHCKKSLQNWTILFTMALFYVQYLKDIKFLLIFLGQSLLEILISCNLTSHLT